MLGRTSKKEQTTEFKRLSENEKKILERMEIAIGSEFFEESRDVFNISIQLLRELFSELPLLSKKQIKKKI